MKSLPLCAAAIVLLASAACNNGTEAAAPQPAPKVFSEADVAKAQDAITHDYQNRGFEVEQVSLIKDSDRHLSGFIKFRRASGIMRPQWTKTCAATMDQDSGKYIYGCQ
ncbi:MAG: hypothetical protein ABSA78_05145 [Candidatus Sulfotelmatobacter sp.]|jgi:hypothetical protein